MTPEDDDIPAGPLSFEAMLQVRCLSTEVCAQLQAQAKALASKLQDFAWALDQHQGNVLEPSLQDLLESAKEIATQANEVWATVERETGK